MASERSIGVMARWRERRRRRAELALADAQHTLAIWGDHIGTKPSDRDRMERAVERARQKQERCS